MFGVTVTIPINRFGEFAGTLDETIETALDAGVVACIAAADPRTPVDTGALRANKTISGGAGERIITWNQHYAAYQNFGTSRGVPANHFAEAGADAALPVIEANLGRWPG